MFRHPFFIKLLHWEYWPMGIAIIPNVLFWLVSAAHTRSLGFYSIVNPSMEVGGLFGASKYGILQSIPERLLPKTIFVKKEKKDPKHLFSALKNENIGFPCIAKPDIGERGLQVEKIQNAKDLANYATKANFDFMLQAYIDLPLELSVFVYEIPGTDEAAITSICEKEFLSITGNGKDSLVELIDQKPRAILQKKKLYQKHKPLWTTVIPKGKKINLEPIGNHCRGTKFLNANDSINHRLTEVFTAVLREMEEVHYGRFDLRADSWTALEKGEFKVMEFNGANSDPAHVFDPSYPVWRAYWDYWQHQRILQRIYFAKKKKGYNALNTKEIWLKFKEYRAYIKAVHS